MTNSARWLQWKNIALPPLAKPGLDQDIVAEISLKVRELYERKEQISGPDLEPHVALYVPNIRL
jgi:hypothetical protein